MHKFYSIISIIFLASLSACSNGKQEPDSMQTDEIPVQIMSIERDSIAQTFRSSGFFTTDNETALSFKNGGVIERMYVQEGDPVYAGQVLASVKTTEIQTMLTQSELGYEKALRDYERAYNLYRDSVATLEQMQNAKTALDLAEQQRAAVNHNVIESQIISRTDGYVLQTFMKEGQVTGPGLPVLLVSGQVKKHWIFKATVNDRQWAAIAMGDSAFISTDIAPGKLLKATVVKKAQAIDQESGGFVVNIAYANTENLPLATGLFAKVEIRVSQKELAWRIPFDAVMEGDGKDAYVFITQDKKIAHKMPIKIQRIQSGYVLVESGLEEVEYLILSGNAYLRDGSSIIVN